MNKDVYNKLIELAKLKQTISYQELCKQCNLGFEMSNRSDVQKLSNILDDISSSENQSGNPLLSAIVFRKERNYPGDGFFIMAKRENRFKGNSDIDKLEFFSIEVRKVFEYWDKK